MHKLKTRAAVLGSMLADYDATEALVQAQCGPGKPFADVIHRDHVEDICAELVARDASLLFYVGDYVSTGNTDDAATMVLDALRGLWVADRDIFEPAPLWQNLYRQLCAVEGGKPVTPADNRGKAFNGKIGQPKDDHRFFWIKDRTDDPTRRRLQYELTKRAADLRKAKKAGA